MTDTSTYLASLGILSSVIVVFVVYYLHEGRKKVELKNKNTELQKQINDLQTEKTNLETKNTELEKQIDELHKQNPHSIVIDMYKTKNE